MVKWVFVMGRQGVQREDVGGSDGQKLESCRLLVPQYLGQGQCKWELTQAALDLDFPQADQAEVEDDRWIAAESQDGGGEARRRAVPPQKRVRVQQEAAYLAASPSVPSQKPSGSGASKSSAI